MTAKGVDALPKPAPRLNAPTCPLFTTSLFAKSCIVFQISLCLFSST